MKNAEITIASSEYKESIRQFVNECPVPSHIQLIEIFDNNTMSELSKIAKNDAEAFC